MNNIFLDLESIPVQCSERRAKLVANAKPPANMSKPETIAKWREENADAIIAKTSLDPAHGHICCISWAVGDDEIVSASIGRSLDNEASVIDEFFSELPQIGMNRFIGHYVTGFDLRFIMCRAVVLGVKVPPMWPRDPKPWDQQVFDTMTAWAGVKGTISQDNLCVALGIETSKGDMDGSKVAEAWANGEYERIAEYCRGDTEAVRKIFRKFEAVGLV